MPASTEPPVIALVGAAGKLGTYVLYSLKTAPYDFVVRTLSRRAEPPTGSDAQNHFQVDFNNPTQLKESLSGCAFLINCMGTSGEYHKSKTNLVDAAAAAGVFGYITSDFGIDHNVPTDHFNHPVWHEKSQHIEYAKSLGLRTIAVCPGLFLEHPFGAFGPWHGFDFDSRTFIVAGTGNEPITITSKVDIGAAVARICHLLLTTEASNDPSQTKPLANKDYIRISGHALTPYEVVDIINRGVETGNAAKEADSKYWQVTALTSEEQRQRFQASMKLLGVDDISEAALDADTGFDADFANDIAGRIFRAMGDGSVNYSQNDNEILNPRQELWKWTRFTDIDLDTKPKVLW